MRLLTVLTGLVISMASLTSALAQDEESVSGEILNACVYPKDRPSIPNGKTASEAELLAAQNDMKAYLAKGDEFINCVDHIEDSWSEDKKKTYDSLVTAYHNRMFDDMNEVADLFNTSVRAFKGRK